MRHRDSEVTFDDLVLAFPLAFIALIFVGNKPVYKTQPCNFFPSAGWGSKPI